MTGKWHGRKCPVCGEGLLHDSIRPRVTIYQGQRVCLDQPGAYCDNCGDGVVYLDERLEAKWIELHRAVDESIRLELIAIRDKLKLTQKEAAQICGGGHNAFSRYERGKANPVLGVVNLWRLLGKYPHLLQEFGIFMELIGKTSTAQITVQKAEVLPSAFGRNSKFVEVRDVYVGSGGAGGSAESLPRNLVN